MGDARIHVGSGWAGGIPVKNSFKTLTLRKAGAPPANVTEIDITSPVVVFANIYLAVDAYLCLAESVTEAKTLLSADATRQLIPAGSWQLSSEGTGENRYYLTEISGVGDEAQGVSHHLIKG